ncbi:oligosaccharyl transferase glycoprotein complex, beta subunit [Yamadazyma tenuis]|uniref:Dolichyl-diphosphooligosaccharide--protein glycosyltransferase subunit WBP1 n=1 Tax=Candida tenuis (strain ATCC 10573 / BCRC 21748 / CBS 615 / JCM 9827 / NBRC 10315 / NRRL Y-1498 / VKM Y-70) TaxID=590646 RepID=G3BAA2_CANTC|nr:oligosaccharyl transferase beta subunit precursor [Yamadazyma tenuis ATCC 10573]XP_006688683.1 uncharacterized protein CANTEDRAFT_114866 [Yamadazyma tenuis ATCC 10573]EGV62512.1 oligosaccharyl transferase beta subunit precursor [Yamadazyma tenuis ATCC 10573]EGV62513.1 hypothetical protein CANTEDRAFT_114866 [Yamadazyma tenuis ATCC 10573]WEJ92610.1 oligosaccharyl transferase glycoprotein complex, beta subunit [Yamadazyma tenuis]
MFITRLVALLSLVFLAVAERSLVVYDSVKIDLAEPPIELKRVVETFKSLGHEILLRGYQDSDLLMFVSGYAIFDNIVFLPTSSKKINRKEQLNKQNLVDIAKTANLVFVGDSNYNYPDVIREFLNEAGIYPSPKGYKLIDHFEASDKVKLTKDNIGCARILSTIDTEYDGQSAILSNNENLVPILTASKTSFSSNDNINPVDNENSWGFGQQSHLAVSLQALSGTRITWVGSIELLKQELLLWAIGQRNALKLQFVQHHKADEPQNLDSTLYRIKDQVVYTIGVSELVDGQWKPFVVENDEETLQLSFKMLDPYQRLNLQPLGEASSVEGSKVLDTYVYSVNFTIPDQHGMFTFELDYKRPGLTYLLEKQVVAIRHLANDEYKRSWDITNAWFYVVSAVLVVIAWFFFVVNFLYVSKVDVGKKDQ